MKTKNYDQAFDELIKCLLKNTKEASNSIKIFSE